MSVKVPFFYRFLRCQQNLGLHVAMNGNVTPTNNTLHCSKFLIAVLLCSAFTHRYTLVAQQRQTSVGNSHSFCKPPIRLVLVIALLTAGIKVRLRSNRQKVSKIRKLIRKILGSNKKKKRQPFTH